jgi:16S rRNA (guanine527-N7)-methyltransferase
LSAQAERLGVSLSASQLARILSYVDLLDTWNRRFRLTGDRSREVALSKHIPDSLAILPFIPLQGPIVDIGTGAGLPGMVIACLLPDLDVCLIESRRRPASFLAETAARLGLDRVRVVEGRAEEASGTQELRQSATAVTARAIRLETLIDLGTPMLEPTGRVIAMQAGSFGQGRVAETARIRGMRVTDTRDYVLTGGERRRIWVLALL